MTAVRDNEAGVSVGVTSVRRADATDAAAVADVYLRARHAAVPAIPPLAHTDDDVRRWFGDVVLADDQREVWVAEADDAAIVGLLVLEDDDWIDQLYVDPEWTGRGIGSQLLEVAKRRRPDALQLWTFASNRGAQRFYERYGFVAVERTDGSGNEERSPDVRYVWSLGRLT